MKGHFKCIRSPHAHYFWAFSALNNNSCLYILYVHNIYSKRNFPWYIIVSVFFLFISFTFTIHMACVVYDILFIVKQWFQSQIAHFRITIRKSSNFQNYAYKKHSLRRLFELQREMNNSITQSTDTGTKMFGILIFLFLLFVAPLSMHT